MKVARLSLTGIPAAVIGCYQGLWFVGVQGFYPEDEVGGVVFFDAEEQEEQGSESAGFICAGWLSSVEAAMECLRVLSMDVAGSCLVDDILVSGDVDMDMGDGISAFFRPDVAGRGPAMPDRLGHMFYKLLAFCVDIPPASWRSECGMRAFSICPGDTHGRDFWKSSEGSKVFYACMKIEGIVGDVGEHSVGGKPEDGGKKGPASGDLKSKARSGAAVSVDPFAGSGGVVVDGSDLVSPIVASGQCLHVRPVVGPHMRAFDHSGKEVEMSAYVAVPSSDVNFRGQDRIKVFLRRIGPQILKLGDLGQARKVRDLEEKAGQRQENGVKS